MKYSKRYIAMAALLFCALALKFSNISARGGEVKRFRGARLEREIWNPLIAETVNGKALSILVDNKELTNQKDGIYMDDNLNLMVPFSVLGESFNCSAHIYEGEKILLEKRSDVVAFQ